MVFFRKEIRRRQIKLGAIAEWRLYKIAHLQSLRSEPWSRNSAGGAIGPRSRESDHASKKSAALGLDPRRVVQDDIQQ
jgi:hypothetical protein